jgi:hypothetical protein
LSHLDLVRVDSSGTKTAVTLDDRSSSGSDAPAFETGLAYLSVGSIVGDADAGVLTAWSYNTGQIHEPAFGHVSDGRLVHLPGSLAGEGNPVLLATSSNTFYIWDDDAASIAALETDTGARRWTGHPTATPVFETDGGHLVAVEYNDTFDAASLVEIDRSGSTVNTTPIPLLSNPLLLRRGQGSLYGLSADGSTVEIATPLYREAESLTMITSSGVSQVDCEHHIPFLTDFKSLVPNSYNYSFVTIWPNDIATGATVSDDVQSAFVNGVRQGFDEWTYANANANGGPLPVRFQPTPQGGSADITVQMIALGTIVQNGKPVLRIGRSFPPQERVLSNKHTTGYVINLTANSRYLKETGGFIKSTLHELGHAHGLDDNFGDKGSTVMNQFSFVDANKRSGADDPSGQVPLDVTSCDERRASQAINR